MSEIWIQPTGGALGADVHGIDLSRPVSETQFERIAEAWSEHLVLRFALRVPDLDAALANLAKKGITPTHPPVVTPWRDYNARIVSPDGLQITLFQTLDQS